MDFGCTLYYLDEFVSKVEYFRSHREEIEKMRKNARNLAEKEFARDIISQRVLDSVIATQQKVL